MTLPDFSKVKVLVIGDVMLDRYMFGTVNRISPEAPVPVVHLKETQLAVGGAANVAANIVGLGAQVVLVGIVGDDPEAIELRTSLDKVKISPLHLLSSPSRQTSVKTRVVAQNHHIVRIDQETVRSLDVSEEESVCSSLDSLIDDASVVLISDYAKGFLTARVIRETISKGIAKSKFVVVDPKGTDFSKYRGASILTPNRKEAFEASMLGSSDLDEVGEDLLRKNDFSLLLITEGEAGMSCFEKELQPKSFRQLHGRFLT
jgi:rfaE bifunctional protein kinase chain/domain